RLVRPRPGGLADMDRPGPAGRHGDRRRRRGVRHGRLVPADRPRPAARGRGRRGGRRHLARLALAPSPPGRLRDAGGLAEQPGRARGVCPARGRVADGGGSMADVGTREGARCRAGGDGWPRGRDGRDVMTETRGKVRTERLAAIAILAVVVAYIAFG